MKCSNARLRCLRNPPSSGSCFPRMPPAFLMHRTAHWRRCAKLQQCPFSEWATSNWAEALSGGPLMQTSSLGRQAAEVALRVLRGETRGESTEPPNVTFGEPMYDWRELRRWNISEARLPV